MDTKQVRDWIANNKTIKAIHMLLEQLDKTGAAELKEALLLSNRYYALKSDKRSGVISEEDYQLEHNKINLAILELCELLEEQSREEVHKFKEEHDTIRRIGEALNYANFTQSAKAVKALVRESEKTKQFIIQSLIFEKLRAFTLKSPEASRNSDTFILSQDFRLLKSEIISFLFQLSQQYDGIEFSKTDFEYADLAYAKFDKLNLEGMSFKGSFLIHADFSSSNLKNCNFDYTQLRNSNFKQAELENLSLYNSDWYNTLGLTLEQFSLVDKRSINRKMPEQETALIESINEWYFIPFEEYQRSTQKALIKNWKVYHKNGLAAASYTWGNGFSG